MVSIERTGQARPHEKLTNVETDQNLRAARENIFGGTSYGEQEIFFEGLIHAFGKDYDGRDISRNFKDHNKKIFNPYGLKRALKKVASTLELQEDLDTLQEGEPISFFNPNTGTMISVTNNDVEITPDQNGIGTIGAEDAHNAILIASQSISLTGKKTKVNTEKADGDIELYNRALIELAVKNVSSLRAPALATISLDNHVTPQNDKETNIFKTADYAYTQAFPEFKHNSTGVQNKNATAYQPYTNQEVEDLLDDLNTLHPQTHSHNRFWDALIKALGKDFYTADYTNPNYNIKHFGGTKAYAGSMNEVMRDLVPEQGYEAKPEGASIDFTSLESGATFSVSKDDVHVAPAPGEELTAQDIFKNIMLASRDVDLIANPEVELYAVKEDGTPDLRNMFLVQLAIDHVNEMRGAGEKLIIKNRITLSNNPADNAIFQQAAQDYIDAYPNCALAQRMAQPSGQQQNQNGQQQQHQGPVAGAKIGSQSGRGQTNQASNQALHTQQQAKRPAAANAQDTSINADIPNIEPDDAGDAYDPSDVEAFFAQQSGNADPSTTKTPAADTAKPDDNGQWQVPEGETLIDANDFLSRPLQDPAVTENEQWQVPEGMTALDVEGFLQRDHKDQQKPTTAKQVPPAMDYSSDRFARIFDEPTATRRGITIAPLEEIEKKPRIVSKVAHGRQKGTDDPINNALLRARELDAREAAADARDALADKRDADFKEEKAQFVTRRDTAASTIYEDRKLLETEAEVFNTYVEETKAGLEEAKQRGSDAVKTLADGVAKDRAQLTKDQEALARKEADLASVGKQMVPVGEVKNISGDELTVEMKKIKARQQIETAIEFNKSYAEKTSSEVHTTLILRAPDVETDTYQRLALQERNHDNKTQTTFKMYTDKRPLDEKTLADWHNASGSKKTGPVGIVNSNTTSDSTPTGGGSSKATELHKPEPA